MNHLFKKQALKDLVKYNQWLLVSCSFLALSNLILSFLVFHSEEKWVLIPSSDPNNHINVSSKGYSETYLKEWAFYVMQTLMTTSHDTVDAQIEELKVVSSSSDALNHFLKKHGEFVKGSNIQSVFFPKSVKLEESAVLINGLFRYWLGSSDKVISLEKNYRLTYKRGPKEILLLKEVKEIAI